WFGMPFSPKKSHPNGTCRTFFCETGKTAILRSLYLLGVASFGAVAVEFFLKNIFSSYNLTC
ncbi:MAG: hypothetical protein II859_05300, partial [Bacteroidales bacterium]|nr:hypothetical protein [Bacteroidales bacterium]